MESETNFITGAEIVAKECQNDRGWKVRVLRDNDTGATSTNLVCRVEFVLDEEAPPYDNAPDFFLDAINYIRKTLEYAMSEYAQCNIAFIRVWLVAQYANDAIPSYEDIIMTNSCAAAAVTQLVSHLSLEVAVDGPPPESLAGLSMHIERV